MIIIITTTIFYRRHNRHHEHHHHHHHHHHPHPLPSPQVPPSPRPDLWLQGLPRPSAPVGMGPFPPQSPRLPFRLQILLVDSRVRDPEADGVVDLMVATYIYIFR
jgi:hypothetical protein